MARVKIKRGNGIPSGLTFGELAYDATSKRLYIGVTSGNELLTSTDGGVSSLDYGYGPQTGAVDITGVMFDTYNVWGYPQEFSGQAGSFLGYPALKVKSTAGPEYISIDCVQTPSNEAEMEFGGATYSTILKRASTTVGDYTVYLPENSGYLITSGGVVTSVNGATGDVTAVATVSGIAGILAQTDLSGNVSLTNTGVESVAAGSGISVSGSTGAITITNVGVHSVNGSTGAVTNIAVTNTAQSFTGIQRFTSGLTATGFTLTDGTNTASYAPTSMSFGGGASLVIDAPAVDFVSTGALGFGDINLVANQTKMYLDDTSRRLYLNTSSGNNAFLNINRVLNTTSAVLINHTTGKTLRLVYNTPAGAVTNYADLDVSSSGDLLITPNGGDTNITGNVNISGGITASGITSAAYAISSAGINALTGVTYTFLASDNGKVLTHNNSGGATLTVPSGLPVGFSATIIHIGTGSLGITSASGVTLNSWTSKYRSVGQHATLGLISYSSNIFNLSGGLTG